MEIRTGFGRLAAPESPLVATIGNFDGLHLGHQEILSEVRAEAARRGLLSAAVTFDPHPLRVLAPERAPKMILTRRQKIELIGALGIDLIVFIPFDHEVAAVAPEEFARRFLTGRLRVACLIVGPDFRFGKDRAGDVPLLKRLGQDCGFEVRTAPVVEQGGARISATQVREAIARGDMARAAALMGRPYVLMGTVIAGEGRGRSMKTPTANLAPENELLPGDGVYVTETMVELEWHPSLTNVGSRPTFEGAGFAIETFLPDFDGNLYGSRLRVRFLERIRDEKKFSGPDELKAQIAEDLKRMRARFASRLGAGSGAGGSARTAASADPKAGAGE